MVDEPDSAVVGDAAHQLQGIRHAQQQIAQRKHLHAHAVAVQPFADQQEHGAKAQQMHAKHAENDGGNHGQRVGECRTRSVPPPESDGANAVHPAAALAHRRFQGFSGLGPKPGGVGQCRTSRQVYGMPMTEGAGVCRTGDLRVTCG